MEHDETEPDRRRHEVTGEGLSAPGSLTAMLRLDLGADLNEPAPAGPEVVGLAAPAGGAPRPGPAVPYEGTHSDADAAQVPMPGQQLEAGEG